MDQAWKWHASRLGPISWSPGARPRHTQRRLGNVVVPLCAQEEEAGLVNQPAVSLQGESVATKCFEQLRLQGNAAPSIGNHGGSLMESTPRWMGLMDGTRRLLLRESVLPLE